MNDSLQLFSDLRVECVGRDHPHAPLPGFASIDVAGGVVYMLRPEYDAMRERLGLNKPGDAGSSVKVNSGDFCVGRDHCTFPDCGCRE